MGDKNLESKSDSELVVEIELSDFDNNLSSESDADEGDEGDEEEYDRFSENLFAFTKGKNIESKIKSCNFCLDDLNETQKNNFIGSIKSLVASLQEKYNSESDQINNKENAKVWLQNEVAFAVNNIKCEEALKNKIKAALIAIDFYNLCSDFSEEQAFQPLFSTAVLSSRPGTSSAEVKTFFNSIKTFVNSNDADKDLRRIEEDKITVCLEKENDTIFYTITPQANSNTVIYTPSTPTITKTKQEADKSKNKNLLQKMCSDALRVAQDGQIFTISQGTKAEQAALLEALKLAIAQSNTSHSYLIEYKGHTQTVRAGSKTETQNPKPISFSSQSSQPVLDNKAQKKQQEVERALARKQDAQTWVAEMESSRLDNWNPGPGQEALAQARAKAIKAANSAVTINHLQVSKLRDVSGFGNNCLPNVMAHAIFENWDACVPNQKNQILDVFKEFYSIKEEIKSVEALKQLYLDLSTEDQEKIFGPVIRHHMRNVFVNYFLNEKNKEKFSNDFYEASFGDVARALAIYKDSVKDSKHPLYTLDLLMQQIKALKLDAPNKSQLKQAFCAEYYKCFGDCKLQMLTTNFSLKAYANYIGFDVKIFTPDYALLNRHADDFCKIVDTLPENTPDQDVRIELNKIYLQKDGNYLIWYLNNENKKIKAEGIVDFSTLKSEHEDAIKQYVVSVLHHQYDLSYSSDNEFIQRMGGCIGTLQLYNQDGNHWVFTDAHKHNPVKQNIKSLTPSNEAFSDGSENYSNVETIVKLKAVIHQVLAPRIAHENRLKR